MQVDAVHVLVDVAVSVSVADLGAAAIPALLVVSVRWRVRVIMAMAVAVAVTVSMIMPVIMPVMMVVPKSQQSNYIDAETQEAYNGKFQQPFCMNSLPKPLKRLKGDLQTNKPTECQ